MAQQVGSRIIRICEILEILGPSTSAEVHVYIDQCSIQNVRTYCKRAVSLGLLTVSDGNHTRYLPNIYSIAPNWRQIVDSKKAKPVQPKKIAKLSGKFAVNSVFQLGGL